MIELRIPVDDGLAQNLEDHFCEEYQECWMLHLNQKTGEQQLRGFFDTKEDSLGALASLRTHFPDLSRAPEFHTLEDRDWKEAYKLHFKPWSERGLHWVPVWERDTYTLPEGDEIVYLDPGMAFGTGNHETTRLCVRRLLDARDDWGIGSEAKSRPVGSGFMPRSNRGIKPLTTGPSVIDAGCGSGILAISARKIGFTKIYGFDIDPDSIRISLDNETLCDVEDTIEFKWADLKEGLQGRTGDLLLVNILANILCDHVELLCRSVNPRGRLVLSGILAREVEEVHAVFAAEMERVTGNLPDMDSRTDGDWADLCYTFPDLT